MRIGNLAFAVLMLFATCVEASRRYRPMGDYIRESDVIVIADTETGGENGYDTAITFREILKGDANLVGKTLTHSRGNLPSSADVFVPRKSKGIAILLKKDWQMIERPYLEIYQKSEEIEVLREIVKIYAKGGERDRLNALLERLDDKNPLYRKQLFADLAAMRDPANFVLLADLYKSIDKAGQLQIIELMGQIGDLRALPTLLEAMKSPDKQISESAALKLETYFPGAPGVTAAFREAFISDNTNRMATRYLMKRDPELKSRMLRNRSSYSAAEAMEKLSGKNAAKPLWLKIVEDEKDSDYARLWGAEKIVDSLSPDENARVRKAMLPLLNSVAGADNYLQAENAARILRRLHHEECLGALLKILGKQPNRLYAKSGQIALFAILDLGPHARAKAFDVLVDRIKAIKKGQTEEFNLLFTYLAVVGDDDSYSRIEQNMEEFVRASLRENRCSAFLGINTCQDEGLFLINLLNLLKERRRYLEPVIPLIIYRLGDLREKRAIAELFKILIEQQSRYDYATSEALAKIGGAEVEQTVMPLLTNKDEDWVRREAIEILVKVQGQRARPLLRRMLTEKDFGLPGLAAHHLGMIGTPEDLPLLLPLDDYWTTDRKAQVWAHYAISSIRERYDYDIDGPIAANSAGK